MPGRATGRVIAAPVPVMVPVLGSALGTKSKTRPARVPHSVLRATRAIPEATRPPDWLPHRELRRRPCRHLAVRPWECRANQLPVNWPLLFFLPVRLAVGGSSQLNRLFLARWLGRVDSGQDGRFRVIRAAQHRSLTRHARQHFLIERPVGVLLLASPRHPGVPVVVLGIAGGTARLLDGLVDHRHDRVIRDPAFARTVVVQNVTKPRLALLHQSPRRVSGGRQGNWNLRKREDARS